MLNVELLVIDNVTACLLLITAFIASPRIAFIIAQKDLILDLRFDFGHRIQRT